jgi:hypothetical protein
MITPCLFEVHVQGNTDLERLQGEKKGILRRVYSVPGERSERGAARLIAWVLKGLERMERREKEMFIFSMLFHYFLCIFSAHFILIIA